jgi:hypothetical protein
MRRKDWARLLDPAQHIYSRAQPDPFAPAQESRPAAPPALRAEIRRLLLAEIRVNVPELARNFCVPKLIARHAVEFESGRIAGERYVASLWFINQPIIGRAISSQKTATAEAEERAEKLLLKIAKTRALFTTDDMADLNKEQGGTPLGSAIYAVMARMQKKGICVPTEHHEPSKSNRHRLRIWRSLIKKQRAQRAAPTKQQATPIVKTKHRDAMINNFELIEKVKRYPDMSERRLAVKLGISHGMVQRIRRRLVTAEQTRKAA